MTRLWRKFLAMRDELDACDGKGAADLVLLIGAIYLVVFAIGAATLCRIAGG